MLFLALIPMFLTGCAKGPPQPVEIEEADSCALCKMAISQKQYAAELIDAEERVYKFDDIGCLLKFAADRNLTGRAPENVYLYFRDFDGAGWIKGDSAQFVRSPEIPSPMASGIIAVSNRQKAESHAVKFGGGVFGFEELWKKK